MLYLFLLNLCSAVGFSLYLFLCAGGVENPIVYVFLGWFSAMASYLLTCLFDGIRLNILNRNYEAYIISGNNDFWNGRIFTTKGFPKLFYNNFQIDRELRKLHKEGHYELYVRVTMPDIIEQEEEDIETLDE